VTGVTLRGAGGEAFCAGIDSGRCMKRSRSRSRLRGELLRSFYRLLHRLGTYQKPTVAIMHGATMARCGSPCSARSVSRPRETYFAVPECKLGYFPTAR